MFALRIPAIWALRSDGDRGSERLGSLLRVRAILTSARGAGRRLRVGRAKDPPDACCVVFEEDNRREFHLSS